MFEFDKLVNILVNIPWCSLEGGDLKGAGDQGFFIDNSQKSIIIWIMFLYIGC